MQGDSRVHVAILHLEKARKELTDNFVPESILQVVDNEIKEMQETLRLEYEEYVARLEKAKGEGKDKEIQNLLEKIEFTCGSELLKKAEEIIKGEGKDQEIQNLLEKIEFTCGSELRKKAEEIIK